MLAIVIPYYKLTFFDATLESLSNQTDKRFKVYIGDDASPYDPVELLEKYKGEFDFVYHRFEMNLGSISLVKQWERCIALSGEGEWLMILGDDDVLDNNVVEAFHKNLEKLESIYTVVRFASCKIDNKGGKTSSIYHNPAIGCSTDILFKSTRSSLSEYIFHKKQVKAIGFKDFPLAWFSDVLAVLEFSDFKNIFSINEAVIYIRITALSISGRNDNLKLKANAKFEFYYYLLSYKKEYFDLQQKKELLKKLNNCYLNDKKELFLFFKISKMYGSNFLIKEYFSFIKLIILSVFKSFEFN